MRIIAEREHYLLVSDGKRFTVVERRAGKFYPLCNGIRHGCDLNDEGVAELVREFGLVLRKGRTQTSRRRCWAMARPIRTRQMSPNMRG